MKGLLTNPQPPPAASAGRLSQHPNIFDFIRLVAAVAVLFAHTNSELGTEVGWDLFGLIDGVPVFFILSGMLVYASAEKIAHTTGRWRAFFVNRWLRIAPALYVFALGVPVSLAVLGMVTWSSLMHFDLVVWFGSSILLAWADVGTGVMNGPLYTIPAEVSFYLVVPLLVVAARRFGFWRMVGGMGLLSVAGAWFSNQGDPITIAILHHTFLERAGCFTAGIILARYATRIPLRWGLMFLATGIYLLLKVYGPGNFVFKPVLIAAPLAYMILFTGFRGPRVLQRITGRIGDLSYGTYIWHYFVINCFIWYGLQGWAAALGILVTTLLLAAASWFGVERHALKLKAVTLRPTATETLNRSEERKPVGVAASRAEDV
jgi:peptidoglycan/LPS O-acetylase OafA/YrhL